MTDVFSNGFPTFDAPNITITALPNIQDIRLPVANVSADDIYTFTQPGLEVGVPNPWGGEGITFSNLRIRLQQTPGIQKICWFEASYRHILPVPVKTGITNYEVAYTGGLYFNAAFLDGNGGLLPPGWFEPLGCWAFDCTPPLTLGEIQITRLIDDITILSTVKAMQLRLGNCSYGGC